jgi:hypothetical protein
VIVLSGPGHASVDLLVLLDIDLLEVLSGESEGKGPRLGLLLEGRLEGVAVRGGAREGRWVQEAVKSASVAKAGSSLRFCILKLIEVSVVPKQEYLLCAHKNRVETVE